MKKALSVVLAMLMVFSMVGVMAFAEGEEVSPDYARYVFLNDDGKVIKTFDVKIGENVTITQEIPEEPLKAETPEARYIFKHWVDENGTIYHRSTIKAPTENDGGKTFTYTAVYSVEDISVRQSLWNLIESIFERINRLFEYFATIFEW